MLGAEVGQVQKDDPVHRWWTTCAHLSGHLQRRKPFRQDSQGRLHYTLLPIDESELSFFRLSDDSEPTDLGLSPKGLAREIELPTGPRINAWAVPRYLDALRELADVQEVELRDCAMKYGTIDLPGRKPEQIWRYHEFLGFSRYRGQ